MMKLKFSTVNASFEASELGETARILRDIADKITQGRRDGSVMDLNGNRIGTWEYTPEYEGVES